MGSTPEPPDSPPEVGLQTPGEGEPLIEGDTGLIRAAATDDLGVARVDPDPSGPTPEVDDPLPYVFGGASSDDPPKTPIPSGDGPVATIPDRPSDLEGRATRVPHTDQPAPPPAPVPFWRTPAGLGILGLVAAGLLAGLALTLRSLGDPSPTTVPGASAASSTTPASTTTTSPDPSGPSTSVVSIPDPLESVPLPVVEGGLRLGLEPAEIAALSSLTRPYALSWYDSPGLARPSELGPAITEVTVGLHPHMGDDLIEAITELETGLQVIVHIGLDGRPIGGEPGAGTQLAVAFTGGPPPMREGIDGLAGAGWDGLLFLDGDGGYTAVDPQDGYKPLAGGTGFLNEVDSFFAFPASWCVTEPGDTCYVAVVNFYRESDGAAKAEDPSAYQFIGFGISVGEGPYDSAVDSDALQIHVFEEPTWANLER